MDTERTLAQQGEELLECWERATKEVERLRDSINGAECARNNAATALGRFLTPDDASVGEKFHVWRGKELIEVEVLDLSGNGTYKITKRRRRAGRR